MTTFNQALLQREAELLSSLRDVAAEEGPTAFPVVSLLEQPAVRWPVLRAPSRWEMSNRPGGELVKLAVR